MNSINNHPVRSHSGARPWRLAAVLWRVVPALLLAAARMQANAADPSTETTNASRIAVFRLDGQLSEAPVDETLSLFNETSTSLKDLVSRMDKAAHDPDVKAVVILPESAAMGLAQVEELRAEMAAVRGAGKEVYVHADSLMLGQYVLACGASRISVVPSGDVVIPGLDASSLHVRGLLDKIGAKPDFITEGAYKSAAELFMREQPSPEADEMMNWLMDSWYASLKDLIAKGRKADPGAVQGWIDAGLYTANQAKTAGVIDAVEQKQDFDAMLKGRYGKDVVLDRKYGRDKQAGLDLSGPFAFMNIWAQLLGGSKKKETGKPAIGIVYVDGPIMTGKGTPSPFGSAEGAYSTEVRKALEEAAKDDSIKAVVLRVNSPGGSVTASEIILGATRQVKAMKPFVVSMGNVAGSGGYYVACAADTIFADSTTLTGSIGVLGGKLATTEMWQKVGITFKEYKRGQNAGMFSTADVFTDSERARVKLMMDEVYATFKSHVTEIRGSRLKKPIDDLAGGRVYTGKQALDLGLVDRLGTMSDAVEFAANQAKIKDYDVRVVPKAKTFLEQLMEQISGEKDEESDVRMTARGDSLFKLAAPYLQGLDPQRTAAIASVFQRLQILQQEAVVLTMPEILP
jgi:protease IV